MPAHCPCCDSDVDTFLDGPGSRPGARCPHCASLERHRFLVLLIEDLAGVVGDSQAVLECAPTTPTRRALQRLAPARYVSIDVDRHFRPTVLGDLTRLPLADNAIDFVVCSHVLEHIPDDKVAVAEIARVMSHRSIALIVVPRRKDLPTDEDPDATEAERLDRFGQVDHVRYYGADFEARLHEHGLLAAVVTPGALFTETAIERYGLLRNEEVWICTSVRAQGSAHGRQRDLTARLEQTEARLAELRSHPAIRALITLTRPFRRAVETLRG